MKLATFAHISDLHFGTVGQSVLARAKKLIHRIPGAQGHDRHACTCLEQFFRKHADAQDARLIMTGDLTSWGHHDQFQQGVDFLSKPPNLRAKRKNGLNIADWYARSIPGNHDQWPGQPTFYGLPTQGLFESFPCHSFIRPYPLPKASPLSVTFIGVDTDVDVHPLFGDKRVRAIGSFCSQLKTLANRLPSLGKHEIRVMLLHHSRAHKGKTLIMDDASRTELDKFINSHGIAVLLTGHVHVPLVLPPIEHETAPVLEARCGTTTKHFLIPFNWTKAASLSTELLNHQALKPLLSGTHSLLLHTIEQQDNTVYWETNTYVRFPERGFLSFKELEALGLPKIDTYKVNLSARVKVWPRE